MSPRYLLIGSGRLSTHFGHYFGLLGIQHLAWSRKTNTASELAKMASASSHILCLISDPAIDGFLTENEALFEGKLRVHASGSLISSRAHGAHPLMTFAGESYDLDTYRSIPFVTENGAPSFEDLMPALPNPSFTIEPQDKALYHALCVLSGNFTVALWKKAFTEFETRLGLPRQALLPYLKRVAANLERDPTQALTGPLSRGDVGTIQKHLETLGADPYANVYRAFASAISGATAPTTTPTTAPQTLNPNGGRK